MTNIPLRIQAGKRYRRRDGLETGSILNVKVAGYPFLDPTSRQTYSDFGCVYHSGITDGRDLVAEIPEPTPAPPEPEQTEAAPQKTLRDEFAMVALPAIIQTGWLSEPGVSPEYTAALLAYRVADAMHEAREERS